MRTIRPTACQPCLPCLLAVPVLVLLLFLLLPSPSSFSLLLTPSYTYFSLLPLPPPSSLQPPPISSSSPSLPTPPLISAVWVTRPPPLVEDIQSEHQHLELGIALEVAGDVVRPLRHGRTAQGHGREQEPRQDADHSARGLMSARQYVGSLAGQDVSTSPSRRRGVERAWLRRGGSGGHSGSHPSKWRIFGGVPRWGSSMARAIPPKATWA
eukprot:5215147-Pyramimonas_sp.AAC.1